MRVERPPAAEDGRRSPPRFERIGNDTFIYRMQWQQSEEAAEALRLLLQEQTGREIIILPHEESNSILFRVLPRPTDRPAER